MEFQKCFSFSEKAENYGSFHSLIENVLAIHNPLLLEYKLYEKIILTEQEGEKYVAALGNKKSRPYWNALIFLYKNQFKCLSYMVWLLFGFHDGNILATPFGATNL